MDILKEISLFNKAPYAEQEKEIIKFFKEEIFDKCDIQQYDLHIEGFRDWWDTIVFSSETDENDITTEVSGMSHIFSEYPEVKEYHKKLDDVHHVILKSLGKYFQKDNVKIRLSRHSIYNSSEFRIRMTLI